MACDKTMTSDISHDDQNENFCDIDISVIAERGVWKCCRVLLYPLVDEHIQQDKDNKWNEDEEN